MTQPSTCEGMRPSSPPEQDVAEAVRRQLENCRYGFIFRKVSIVFKGGRLILSGSVPSFYLKQNLQELLRNTPHVKQIINDVDVVCVRGLSSVRPRNPR